LLFTFMKFVLLDKLGERSHQLSAITQHGAIFVQDIASVCLFQILKSLPIRFL